MQRLQEIAQLGMLNNMWLVNLHTTTVVCRMLNSPSRSSRYRHLQNFSILAEILLSLKKLVETR